MVSGVKRSFSFVVEMDSDSSKVFRGISLWFLVRGKFELEFV